MNDSYALASEAIRELQTTLSLPVSGRAFKKSFATTINKLDALVNDNQDYGRWIVHAMEQQTGSQFIPTLSGMSMRTVLPSGLAGRSNLIQGVRGLATTAASAVGATAATSAVGLPFIVAMPFFSPALVGRLYHVLGRAAGLPAKHTKRLSSALEEMHKHIEKKYPRLADAHYSLGQVISAVDVEDAFLYNSMLHRAIHPEDETPSVMPSEDVPDLIGEYASDAYREARGNVKESIPGRTASAVGSFMGVK